MEGFIPIKRSLFDHFLFTEKRVYSRFEAWLDLIQMATFQEENTRLVKGKAIKCRKGQLIASVRFLQDRWSWSTHKVCDFIELLRSQDMLLTDKEEGVNRITLTNFQKHNEIKLTDSKRDTKRDSKRPNSKEIDQNKGTQVDTEKGTETGQSGDSQGTNTNNDNNDKKGNDVPASAGALSLEDKFKNFRDWIHSNALQVEKLSTPFTLSEYLSLRMEYDINDIMDVLQAMHNKKTLLKDYTSAYLTCLNWLKMRESKGQNRKKNGSQLEGKQSKAEIVGQQIAQGLSGSCE